ncbi:MAG: glycoside hydrolase family 6 protein [Candidatus Uhrbacteria bacterium]|nr:glycoside hydrolase family 6 protein [Candidatus Uhrbacteria bacterium]
MHLTPSLIFAMIVSSFFTIAIPSVFANEESLATAQYGDYVKGESFPDIYFIDNDENGELVRSAFVNEQIFFTWQNNFDNVITLSDNELSSLPLGPLVLPQSGVVLVKIQSANNVYAIEDGELRWITTEEIAIGTYGDDWADYVIDLPPTIFPHFARGEDLSHIEHRADLSIMKTRDALVTGYEAVMVNIENPLANSTFYVNPNSSARQQVISWSTTRPTDALALEKIASQPTARWFGDWDKDIESSVRNYVTTVAATGTLPVLVAYNIPNRDCGYYSAGGSYSNDDYRAWIAAFAAGIGSHAAAVVLEPDATATSCVTDDRLALMGEAVSILKAQANTAVYIDAGHDNWINPVTMAARLQTANIDEADGFALNVSNFYTTEENTVYGTAVSTLTGGKQCLIDPSRTGKGWNGEWCNPTGRRIGVNPTTDTHNVLIDALLWIKPPGESDGTCNGGPSAGTWWAEYALSLVH